jgi:hypothetical protein
MADLEKIAILFKFWSKMALFDRFWDIWQLKSHLKYSFKLILSYIEIKTFNIIKYPQHAQVPMGYRKPVTLFLLRGIIAECYSSLLLRGKKGREIWVGSISIL